MADLRLPLAGWAQARLDEFSELTGARGVPLAETLLGERAALNGLRVPGRVSAGGGCRMWDASNGQVALNLSRPDDRALLPALFGESFDPGDDEAIARFFATVAAASIVARGREIGLAIAHRAEALHGPAVEVLSEGKKRTTRRRDRPRVIDLSSLWAGPLAANLLHLAGAEVIKVENPNRPDGLREGDPAHFALLNGGKASVALDPRLSPDRERLLDLIAGADIVIESARPRALHRLGIDADELVCAHGLAWLNVTAHGASGAAADWVGFGDDCAVAGGLSTRTGLVGDAMADPLTGIVAALAAVRAHRSARSQRIGVSMAGTVREAVEAQDPVEFAAELGAWSACVGKPFAGIASRPAGPVTTLGADNARVLKDLAPC